MAERRSGEVEEEEEVGDRQCRENLAELRFRLTWVAYFYFWARRRLKVPHDRLFTCSRMLHIRIRYTQRNVQSRPLLPTARSKTASGATKKDLRKGKKEVGRQVLLSKETRLERGAAPRLGKNFSAKTRHPSKPG